MALCSFLLGLDVTKYWLIITQLHASEYINAKAGLDVTINWFISSQGFVWHCVVFDLG